MIWSEHGRAYASQLKNIQPYRPSNAGARWRWINPYHLIKTIQRCIQKRGWDIMKRRYFLDYKNRLSLVYHFDPHGDLPDIGINEYCIAFKQTGYDKVNTRIKAAVGISSYKHAGIIYSAIDVNIPNLVEDMPKELSTVLDIYERRAEKMEEWIKQFKSTSIHLVELEHFLMHVGVTRLLHWCKVGRVYYYIRKRYKREYFRVWDVLNLCCQQAQLYPISRQFSIIYQLSHTIANIDKSSKYAKSGKLLKKYTPIPRQFLHPIQ